MINLKLKKQLKRINEISKLAKELKEIGQSTAASFDPLMDMKQLVQVLG